MGPMGDVESAIHFTWELLFLSPWELAYVSIPMTVIAFYVLTIYSAFKPSTQVSIENQNAALSVFLSFDYEGILCKV